MIYGVTYSDEKMSTSADKCVQSMLKHGIDIPMRQDINGIDPVFAEMNKGVLTQERGVGYWLWKPYIVYRAMLEIGDGDILIYCDAGVEIVNSVYEIINRMDQDIFFFTNGFPHVEWCKWDVLEGTGCYFKMTKNGDNMGYTDLSKYYKQVQASVIFFKVNQGTRNLVKEWLLWCQMPGFIDDSPSKQPNYPTFAEHRHDQAILTCLQIKYGYKLHWWPTQYSEHIRVPGDTYPIMFNHHRKRNHEW